jgi:hypothetical protein
MDAARYGRIWELSIRGAHSPDVDGLGPVATSDADGVTVRRFERTPETVLTDFASSLPAAKVDGAHATLELTEVGFAPHRCVQVTPVVGHPTRITFPQAQLGTTLVGYVGLADVFTRREIRLPGQLSVEVDGKTIAIARFGVDDGWVGFSATTTPGVADVVFEARAYGPQRLVCFAAEARR